MAWRIGTHLDAQAETLGESELQRLKVEREPLAQRAAAARQLLRGRGRRHG